MSGMTFKDHSAANIYKNSAMANSQIPKEHHMHRYSVPELSPATCMQLVSNITVGPATGSHKTIASKKNG